MPSPRPLFVLLCLAGLFLAAGPAASADEPLRWVQESLSRAAGEPAAQLEPGTLLPGMHAVHTEAADVSPGGLESTEPGLVRRVAWVPSARPGTAWRRCAAQPARNLDILLLIQRQNE